MSLTIGQNPSNSNNFLASSWSNSFHVFADKPLMRLSLYLVGMGQGRLDELLVMLCRIPIVSWPLIGRAVSAARQTADRIELILVGVGGFFMCMYSTHH